MESRESRFETRTMVNGALSIVRNTGDGARRQCFSYYLSFHTIMRQRSDDAETAREIGFKDETQGKEG